jgi:hypothetical protein
MPQNVTWTRGGAGPSSRGLSLRLQPTVCLQLPERHGVWQQLDPDGFESPLGQTSTSAGAYVLQRRTNNRKHQESVDCFLSSTPGRLANIATRLRVETGDNVLIGFIITARPKVVCVEWESAAWRPAGEPTLELRDALGGLIGQRQLGRFAEQGAILGTIPNSDLESAIVHFAG